MLKNKNNIPTEIIQILLSYRKPVLIPKKDNISATIGIVHAIQIPNAPAIAPSTPKTITNRQTTAPQISPLFSNFNGFLVFILIKL